MRQDAAQKAARERAELIRTLSKLTEIISRCVAVDADDTATTLAGSEAYKTARALLERIQK